MRAFLLTKDLCPDTSERFLPQLSTQVGIKPVLNRIIGPSGKEFGDSTPLVTVDAIQPYYFFILLYSPSVLPNVWI